MTRLFVPTTGVGNWQALLSDPELHWKRGRSAFELAVSWEAAARRESGMPSDIDAVLRQTSRLSSACLVAGFVEHRTPLPGGTRASQSDLWALLCGSDGLISMTVEGKAGEPFDKTVGDWRSEAGEGSGKAVRLADLAKELGLTEIPDSIMYQLVHRTAAAVKEARRCRAASAVMLVQSFSKDERSLRDFEAFSALLGAKTGENQVRLVKNLLGIDLFLGWVSSSLATDDVVAKAVEAG
jgi:hypothetical protein